MSLILIPDGSKKWNYCFAIRNEWWEDFIILM
jgi:hypothetical protein